MLRKLSSIIIPSLFLIASSLSIKAITPTWNVEFGSIFDNREGDAKVLEPRTFFLVNLSPEIGIKFTSEDRIAAGVVWNQPLQNGIKNGKVMPTVYYRHEGKRWNFSMGLFPMSQLKEPLPGFLWCDSLSYYQKNLRGALVQFNNKNGFFESYIDWRGIQSKQTREAFNIVFHGETSFGKKPFITGGYLMMNHFAKTNVPNEDQHIVDNFMYNPFVGVDLSGITALNLLKIKGGILGAVERHRGVSGWTAPVGFNLDLEAEWKFLGVRNSLYAGGKLYRLYGEYGNLLYQGEAYYQSNFYDRLDIYANIYSNKYMRLEAQLNFNFSKETFMFYQRLILEIEIGNLISSPIKSNYQIFK